MRDNQLLPTEDIEGDIEHYLSYAYLSQSPKLKVKILFDNMAHADIENINYNEIDIKLANQDLKKCIEKFHKAGNLKQTPQSSIESIVVFMLQINALQFNQWKNKEEIKEIRSLPDFLSQKIETEKSLCEILALFEKEPEKKLTNLKDKAFSLKFCKYMKNELRLNQSSNEIKEEMLLNAESLAPSFINNHAYYSGRINSFSDELIKIEKELLNLSLKYNKNLAKKQVSIESKTTFKL